MTFHRLPGVLCAITNALPPDAGTQVLGASQPPGLTGGISDESVLGDDEFDWIRKTYGRKADGTLMDVGSLMVQHEHSVLEYELAVGHYGPKSKQARWQEATVAHFARLIEEARAARKDATANLRNILANTKGKGSEKRISEIKAAIVEVFKAAHEDVKAGVPEAAAESADVVVEAFQAVAKADKDTLAALIQKAKVPGNRVTEADLQKPLIEVLSGERQKQLLGIPDAAGEADSGALMAEVLAISSHLRKEKLQKALKNKVSNQEIQKAVAGMLGSERQKQLLGITDETDETSSMELLNQALETFHRRSKVALAGALRAAKSGSATKEQLGHAIADALGVERQRQLLGAPDDNDQELSKLLAQASVTYSRAKSAHTKRAAKTKAAMMMEPIKMIGRIQVR